MQLGSEVVLVAIDAEAHGQWSSQERTIFSLVSNPDVIPDIPFALLGLEVLEPFCLGWILEQGDQCAFAVVVVFAIKVRDSLPLHVGLASQDKDLNGLWGIRGDGRRRDQKQENRRDANNG